MSDPVTIKEALPVFYRNYNLQADGGMNAPSVKIEIFSGVCIYIPNVSARKKVVLKHDIHHLVTGYSGALKGESEISAWELSTGCMNNWAAFILNLFGVLTGVPFNMKGIWIAWLRGKQTRNLYHERYRTEVLLNKTVREVKEELGLLTESKHQPITVAAFLSFAGMLILGGVLAIFSISLVPLLLIYSLYQYLS